MRGGGEWKGDKVGTRQPLFMGKVNLGRKRRLLEDVENVYILYIFRIAALA
jgi:hypothetical protein